MRRSGDYELSRGKATVSMRAAKAVPSRGKLRILDKAFSQPVRLVGIVRKALVLLYSNIEVLYNMRISNFTRLSF